MVGLAVAIGFYPLVRRLTQRLDALQRSVQRWGEGDLSARVPETGQDEVADLSRRFNAAAARIEIWCVRTSRCWPTHRTSCVRR